MLLIVVLTSVLGVALDPAAAITLGGVAAGLCVAVMTQHHRRHNTQAPRLSTRSMRPMGPPSHGRPFQPGGYGSRPWVSCCSRT